MASTEPLQTLDILGILKRLPHRYPFLLVDRVTEVEPGKRLVAIKNVTFNEPFFQGHFPGEPVMPGVLIVEAMAQAGGLLIGFSLPEAMGPPFLASVRKVRWPRPVRPGDQLRLEITAVDINQKIPSVSAKAFVEGQVVAEAEEIMFAFAKPGR